MTSWKELWDQAQEADRDLIDDFNRSYAFSMPPLEVRVDFLKARLELTQAMVAQLYNKLIEDEHKPEGGQAGALEKSDPSH